MSYNNKPKRTYNENINYNNMAQPTYNREAAPVQQLRPQTGKNSTGKPVPQQQYYQQSRPYNQD